MSNIYICFSKKKIIHFSAITPEPDSTEDSTGGFDPSDIPILIGGISSKDPTRRMSQPVTGSVKEAIAIDKATNRRASEGKKIKKS